MEKKEPASSAAKKQASVFATLCFILLSVLMIYSAFRLLGSVVRQEFLTANPTPENIRVPAAATPGTTPENVAEPSSEPAGEVAAIRTPVPPAEGTVLPTPEAPTATPVPTPTPATSASPSLFAAPDIPTPSASPYPDTFQSGCINLVVAMTDGASQISGMAILALRKDQATVIAVPSATQTSESILLEQLRESRVLYGAQQLLPVSFERYACFSESDVKTCIDLIGPVTLSGVTCNGDTVAKRLSDETDSLLRAERFADTLCAIALRVRDMSLLQLLAAKSSLQSAIRTNVPGADGWKLFRNIRALGPEGVVRRTLPVDSVSADSGRFYRIDEKLVKKLADSLFKF